MTSEEKILAYLDGNLSEKESAELLHQLSVSPENRVVLEQHLKLNEMTRLAQKPFEVPEELEASLAKRLPIGLVSFEEAASPAVTAISRSGSIFQMLRQYPLRFALGGLLVLLSGGGVYQYLSSGSTTASNETLTPSTTTTVVTPDANTTSKNQVSSKNTTSSNTPLSASGTHAASNNAGNTATTNVANSSAAKASGSSDISTALRNRSNQSTHNNPSLTNSSVNAGNETHNVSSKNLSSVRSTEIHKSIVNKSITNKSINSTKDNDEVANTETRSMAQNPAVLTNESSNSANADKAMEIPSVAVLADRSSAMPMQAISDAKGRRSLNPFERVNDPERSNFSIRAALNSISTFINVPSGNSSYMTRTEGGFSFALNYNTSPEFAVGIEGGRSSILTVSPQSTVETSLSDQLNHVIVHTYTNAINTWYSRLAARYMIAPFDQNHFEISVEGGALFTTTLSPMIGGQFLWCRTLSEAFEGQLGFAVTGVWSANVATPLQAPSANGPTVYKTESVPANSIFSPTVNLRAGLQYRF